MAIPFMGLYVTQSLHRSSKDAGLMMLFFGVGSILGASAGGKLTDVFGFRPVQILSSIIGGTFFIFFPFLTNFNLLCAFALLISFFYDAFRPANFTAIAAYAAPGKETRSYSLNRLATNTGWAFGISIGGLVAAYRYELLFVVDGLVSIAVGLAILFLLPKIKGYRKAAKLKSAGLTIQKPWRDLLFIRLLITITLFATCFFLMFRVVPVFLKQEWQLNEALIGIVLGINGVVVALFEMVMISKIENKKSPGYYVVWGTIILSCAFACFLIRSDLPVWIAAMSVVCFSFGEMLSIPFINTLVIKRSNEFNRGQYAAGYTVAWSCAQLIGPIGGFYLAENFDYTTLWVVTCILLLICAFSFSRILKRFEAEK